MIQAKQIFDDAMALEQAGVFAVLLELVPDRLCKLITERVTKCFIISLGTGTDAHCRLLIYHDMFGLCPKFKPQMAKLYQDAGALILNGLQEHVAEVTERQFPQPENWSSIPTLDIKPVIKLCVHMSRIEEMGNSNSF